SRSQESDGVLAHPWIVFPDLITKGHRRCVTSGQVRNAVRFAFVLAQTLRLAVSKINDAITTRAPTVVDSLVLRQAPPFVIAIVGDLVIKLIRRGMQLEHPIQSPTRFVEHVGDSVRAGLAE